MEKIPNSIIEDAKKSLGERAASIIATGMNIQKWDARNLKGCCPYHNEKTPSFVWNKKNNSFKCFGCGVSMDILEYYQQSMTFIEAVKQLFRETGTHYDFDIPEKKREYRYPTEEKPVSRAIEYLSTRKISEETARYAGVKEDIKGNIAFEYRNENGTLMMVKYRPSRKVAKGENKNWCQKDKDTTPIMYGMEKADTTKPLLICEGEIDRLAAIEAGFKNTVSIPFGAENHHWIEECWDWLEQFEKLIIWSDKDSAGERMRQEIVPRLGEHRCYIVNSIHKDINVHLYREGKAGVIKAIDAAKDVPIKNVKELADVDDFDINKAEKIKSGINGLDKWIAGFVLGTLNVITGINGSGKSTFINQTCVCEAVDQGYKTFIMSGELSSAQLRSWIEYPMAGKENVKVIDNGSDQPEGYRVTKQIKNLMRDWYRGKLYVYDNDLDLTASTILSTMEKLAQKHGVKNFVLDNLMMIDLECKEAEKYTKQKEFVLKLIRFATRFNAIVHLVVHPRKTEAIRRLTKLDVCGSGDITNLAHYVTSIHRVTNAEKEDVCDKKGNLIEEGCKFDCIIDLFKNRLIGHQDKSVGVYFDMASKRFYGDSDKLGKEYGWRKEIFLPVENEESVFEQKSLDIF